MSTFDLKRAADARSFSPEPGVERAILCRNDRMLLVRHRFAAGWIGTPHAHPHEQIVYVIEGRLLCRCADRSFEVSAGDSFVVPGGVEHAAQALEDSVVLDVFTPDREDYGR